MEAQTYANHVYRPKFWSFTLLLAFLAFLLMVVFLVRQVSVLTIALVILSSSLLCSVMLIRRFALRLQNRIIRLEMQVRLIRLGLDAQLTRLAMPQIVALRFASDAELPALVDRAIAENLSADQIKRAVTNWQGDYLRT
jgi:hypothetical protein